MPEAPLHKCNKMENGSPLGIEADRCESATLRRGAETQDRTATLREEVQ